MEARFIKLIKYFKEDENLDRSLFLVLAVVGSLSNLIGFVATYMIFGMNTDTVIVGICFAAFVAISVVGLLIKRYVLATRGLLAVFCLIECPFLILVYGAGTVCYGMLGAVATVLYLKRKKGGIFLCVSFILNIAALALHYYYPPISSKYALDEKIASMLTTFVICFVTIMLITNIFIYRYKLQNEMLEDLSKQLTKSAFTDPLTGIHNRRYLMDYLDKKQRSGRDETWCAIILDLDFFKKVNDTYGHVFGDMVLKEFAAIMTKHVGGYGIPTRFGGEEFLIIFHTSDDMVINHIMNEIKADLAEFSQREKGIQLTFSGGAQLFDNSMEVTEIFTKADKKLYEAKESGRNRIIF